jgi:hypothetical protein
MTSTQIKIRLVVYAQTHTARKWSLIFICVLHSLFIELMKELRQYTCSIRKKQKEMHVP